MQSISLFSVPEAFLPSELPGLFSHRQPKHYCLSNARLVCSRSEPDGSKSEPVCSKSEPVYSTWEPVHSNGA